MVMLTTEDGMEDGAPLGDQDRRNLRFLRVLVTVLTATMILGVLTVVVLLVIRLQGPAALPLPDRIVLPEGAQASAFTQGPGWFAVVTEDSRILIFDGESGALRQEIPVEISTDR